VAALVKQEEAEVKPRPADLAADRKSPAPASFPVIDNRVSTITAIIKPEAREPDVPSNTPSNAVSVVMAPASVITKQEVKREEEAERAVVRSSQQAKIPLKKRELKLAEGFQDNRNHGNHLNNNNNNNNKGSSIIVCNPSVIQSKDAGQVTNSSAPPVTSGETAPRLELTNGKAALLPLPPPPPPHKEGGQNGVIGVIGQVGVIGHVGVIRSPMERHRGAESQERNGPEGEEEAGDGPGVGRRKWEEKEEREATRQSVLVRKPSVEVETEDAPPPPPPPPPPASSPPHPIAGAPPREEQEAHLLSAQEGPRNPPKIEEERKTLVSGVEAQPVSDAAQGKEREAGQEEQARPGLLEVASSELQKEGIRLKIKIPPHKRSKKKGREEKEREAEQEEVQEEAQEAQEEEEGRSLRRSARICRYGGVCVCVCVCVCDGPYFQFICMWISLQQYYYTFLLHLYVSSGTLLGHKQLL